MGMALLALSHPAGAGQGVLLPSGLTATSLDRIFEEDTATLRLRYIVPELSDPTAPYLTDSERVFEDMRFLCNAAAQPGADGVDPHAEGWRGAVITLMSAPLEFGQRDPAVVQMFEAFIFAPGGCDWDGEEFYD